MVIEHVGRTSSAKKTNRKGRGTFNVKGCGVSLPSLSRSSPKNLYMEDRGTSIEPLKSSYLFGNVDGQNDRSIYKEVVDGCETLATTCSEGVPPLTSAYSRRQGRHRVRHPLDCDVADEQPVLQCCCRHRQGQETNLNSSRRCSSSEASEAA